MKTLIHNKVKDNIPSNSSRNGYGCIEYTEDINQSGSSKITFNRGEFDAKRIPFTIRMLSPGQLTILLLPTLKIKEITFFVINGPHKLDSEIFYYENNDVNWFHTKAYSEGDEIRILVTWEQYATNRTFGIANGYEFSRANIGSCLMCTGKYEVFGNIGSLLFDKYDNRWLADDYAVVGSATFRQFFMNVDTAMLASSSTIEAKTDVSSGLVSAYNLYLPKLNVSYAYVQLFYENTDLKYGPRKIHVCGNSSYCQELLYKCTHIASDYNVFVTSEIVSGEDNNMANMFANIAIENGTTNKAGTLYYMSRDVYNAYSSGMVNGNGRDGVFSNYVFSPNGNLYRNYSTAGTVIGAPEAMPKYEIIQPIIWVDDVNAVINSKGLSGISEYIQNIDKDYGGKPYKYVGTIWLDSQHQSYYLWQYISVFDTSTVSKDPYSIIGVSYIVTSEKDFTGMTLKETGKIMVYPIKFVASTLTKDKGKLYDLDYLDYNDTDTIDLSKFTIIKQSASIPDADAGVPIMSVDNCYNKNNKTTTINYKHFRNNQYKYFDYTDQIGHMWQLCSMQDDINSPITIINDDYYDTAEYPPKYIVTQYSGKQYDVFSLPWDLYVTFLERGSEMIKDGISNYNNYIKMLNSDGINNYEPEGNPENVYIITTNGIQPETCDYIVDY